MEEEQTEMLKITKESPVLMAHVDVENENNNTMKYPITNKQTNKMITNYD